MMRALYTAISGLTNHQTKMDVIGNNIANINTTGFKSNRATFADTLSQTISGSTASTDNLGGTNPQQVGLGMAVSSIDTDFTAGSPSSTGNNTDLAIASNNGLFIVKSGNETYYTRNGNFTMDANGNLTMNGSGYKVQGWNASDGVLNTTGGTEDLKIDMNSAMPPRATSTITFSGNLSADDTAKPITGIRVNYADGTSENVSGSYSPSDVASYTLTGASGRTYNIQPASGTTIADPYVGSVIDNTKTLDSITITNVDSANLPQLDFETTAKAVKGGTVTLPSATQSVMTGTYKVGGSTNIGLGTITGIVNNATGGLDITTDHNGTSTTYTVTNAPAGAYAIGDNLTVSATVAATQTGSITLDNTATTPTTAILTYDDGSSVDSSDFSTAITANLGADAVVNAVAADNITASASLNNTYNNKAVTGITLTMDDGTVQTGFPDQTYATGTNSYPTYTTTSTIYDSLGGAHSIPIYLQKTGADTWRAKVQSGTYDGVQVGSAEQTLTFNGTTGKLTDGQTFNINISVPYENGANQNETVGVNLGSLNQFSGETTATTSKDGYAAGFYKDMTIGSDGIITMTYTNGQKQSAGQIALANFNNPGGLEKQGGSLYAVSNNSGDPQIGTAEANGISLTPGALEMSNVNTAREFSEMITTQRGFQANSKIITVSDEMLETLVNMKR
ncbi:flagellar hook-basal body complex protein [Pectinatus brassicae]|uniref:Flagellar hook protein FlgE n=1 Tax=Pectinatus brassicae TaxID=862415 RepID=A0A840UQY4_9FIRM|nr:flagellar hook-basal body complex protein [Pectinatus brassicae]MBB5336572.1 flagellar hook protein FlgE [Pectinatus brassicae]